MSILHEPPESGRAFRVLRHRDYRLLWSAEFVSTLGRQMQQVAIAWQVFQLTGDPLQLGLLGLFRFLPIVLFGLAGGVVADRRDRKQTLLVTQVVLLATSALLAALTLKDAIAMPVIYAITFFSVTVGAIAGPTRQALIPALVPRREVAGAMSLTILSGQVAAVSGPALGGLVIAQFGVAATYAIDAATFLAVIGAVLAIRARPETVRLQTTNFAAAVEGLRFLRDSPILLGVMVVDFLATFFGASMVLMPIFAGEILDVGAQGLGLLYAAPAAGAVLGGLAMSLSTMPRRPGTGIFLAVAIYGACIMGFGLSETPWLSLLLLAGSGAADAVSMAFRHTIRNLVTPEELRGRIAAAHSTFAMGGPQLGEFEAGALASVVGAGPSVAVGGLGTLLSVGAVAILVPAIARYDLRRDGRQISSQEPPAEATTLSQAP